MKRSLLLIFILLVVNNCYGQGYFNKWYFGNDAGLDFNTNPPSSITGQLQSHEGCASICDYYGKLLFYTNGETVWNSKHTIMPNGTGLLGDKSSTQSALIVPKPGDSNLYYIFTTPGALRIQIGAVALTYSIIDMTLNGGLGGVTSTKNIILHSSSTERVTAIRFLDGSGLWVIGHEPDNNVFFAYKITNAGINPTPILSNVGSIDTSSYSYVGYLKPNHKGNKLAYGIGGLLITEIFDFNKLTGKISNPITLHKGHYGLEFSPDDSRLYIRDGYLYQVNMLAGSNTAIANSLKLIATNFNGTGALQLGPDGKIYVTKGLTSTYLSVINNPNALGISACKYVDNQINLAPNYSIFGFPNFFEMTCSATPIINLGLDKTLCPGDTLVLNASIPFAKYQWQDSSSLPIFKVKQSGTYWVNVIDKCGYTSDTINIKYNPLPTVNLGNDTSLCIGDTLNLNDTFSNAAYLWQDSSTNHSYKITQQGIYWVKVTNMCRTITDTIKVLYNPLPSINLGNDSDLCQGETLTLDGTIKNAKYFWQDSSTNPIFIVNKQGIYWVIVTQNNCSSSDTIKVNFNPLPSVNLGKDTILCEGDTLNLDVKINKAIYLWQDSTGNSSFKVTKQGTYWVKVIQNNCINSDTINISYNSFPLINLGKDTTLCKDDLLILDATTKNATYLWQDNSTNPTFNITKDGIYWVEVTNNCGISSDTLSVEMNDCNCFLYIPNAFTPNTDNLNDNFYPVSNCDFSEYHLLIYNRWGEKIFESNNPQFLWDGTFKNEIVPVGVYLYLISYTFEKGIKETKYGSITLIR